jgi:AcrR family transcriptional regulator
MPDQIRDEQRSKRDAILDAARELFAKKGYEETTIAEIARAAGVAVGTVYLYFRNKHEVLTGVALDLETSIAEVFRDPTILNLPFEDMLEAQIIAIFHVARQKKTLIRLLQIDMQTSEEVQQHLETSQQLTSNLDAFLRNAIEQGHLAPFNTAMYAQLLALLGSAVLHQCFAVENGEREELYRRYMIDFVMRLFFGPSLKEGS